MWQVSWDSGRLPSTPASSVVECARNCIRKHQEDATCDSIMYVKETEDCIMGISSLPEEEEDTEFVYKRPQTGNWGLVSVHNNKVRLFMSFTFENPFSKNFEYQNK